jgi:hypothetical protein
MTCSSIVGSPPSSPPPLPGNPSDTMGLLTAPAHENDDDNTVEKIKKKKWVRAHLDPALTGPRVLDRLLAAEAAYSPAATSNYLYTRRTDITAARRTHVADWMAAVCEDQGCGTQVLLLAVQYLDRLLAAGPAAVQPAELQLAAAACLFVASKLCELHPLTVQIIVLYADDDECVGPTDVLAMEGRLLGRLSWDLVTPTSLDFLHLLLLRNGDDNTELETLEEPVTRFLARAAREYQFCAVRPSVLAAAAILTAVQLAWGGSTEERRAPMQSARWKQLHLSLAHTLNIDKVCLYIFVILCKKKWLEFTSHVQINRSFI